MCTSNRILIVDDDPRTLARYRRALESAGYAVVEAEGEEAALEKLRRSKSDLVLLALSPPWIVDMRVLRRLRGAGDDVPVVIIMARGNPFDAKSALELGAIDFLFEPVRTEELRTVVAEVIRRHDLARSKPVDPAQTAALIAAVFDAVARPNDVAARQELALGIQYLLALLRFVKKNAGVVAGPLRAIAPEGNGGPRFVPRDGLVAGGIPHPAQ